MEHSHPGTLDEVYAAPQSAMLGTAAATAAKLRTRAAKLLGASVLGFALSIGVAFAAKGGGLAALFFLGSAIVALVGAGHGVVAFFRGLDASAGGGAAASALGLTFVNLVMSGLGALTALVSTISFTRGRQIRSFGKILLPPVGAGGAWTTSAASMSSIDIDIDVDDGDTRRALAAQWRENGRTEHASVAAFARLTLDLMALGAPPQLIADANRDSLDEIRHAQLCFGLARALDGRVESPGAFPVASNARKLSSMRTIALGQLAVDSLVDGALHEGVSARIIAKLARRCDVPAIQVMLKEIAADEGRHARHGWDVTLWCLAEGGEPVAHALEGALRALPRVMTSPMDDEARDGRWERFGIMGEALEAEEHEAARAYVERRTAQAIAASRALRQSGFGYGNVSVA
jgi:hypothetical protein